MRQWIDTEKLGATQHPRLSSNQRLAAVSSNLVISPPTNIFQIDKACSWNITCLFTISQFGISFGHASVTGHSQQLTSHGNNTSFVALAQECFC